MQLHRRMMTLARYMAVLGGTVLSLLIILVCISVIGRGMNTFLHSDMVDGMGFAKALLDLGVGPILGDYELVEAGIAFSIFAFMPLCQISAGHASVDIFTSKFPPRINRIIQVIVDTIFAVVLILIAWRLFVGMQSKMRYNETTFLLQFPLWWAYGMSFVGAAVAAIVGVYMAGVRGYEALTARMIVQNAEVDH